MFRRTQVFVGDHIPPQADHIEVLMKSFLSWLNSPEAIGKQRIDNFFIVYYSMKIIKSNSISNVNLKPQLFDLFSHAPSEIGSTCALQISLYTSIC